MIEVLKKDITLPKKLTKQLIKFYLTKYPPFSDKNFLNLPDSRQRVFNDKSEQ